MNAKLSGVRRKGSPYDSFAWFYDKYWAPEVAADFLRAVERLLLKRLPRGSHILDLGCGTGQLAASLVARGFRVTGLDASAEMLRYARRNAPGAAFVKADVTSFALSEKAEAAVAVFDTFNHLLTPDALFDAFTCVRHALAPEAKFVFDLNTKTGFKHHLRDHFTIIKDDAILALQGDYDHKEKLAQFNGTVLRSKGGAWSRADFSITERCYEPLAVEEMLLEVGFRDIKIYDAVRDVGLEEHTGRVFFVARRNAKRADD